MKKISLSILALGSLLVSVEARAVQLDAEVLAEIISPLTISEDTVIDFGTLSTDGSAESVVLDTTDSVACPASMFCSGTPASGDYTIAGAPNGTVTVNVTGATLTETGGDSMAFTSDYTSGSTETLDGTGNYTLVMGGTLSVGAAQTTGTYSTSNAGGSAMTITVNY